MEDSCIKEQQTGNQEVSWFSKRPFIVIGILLIGCLGPFVNKAIQTDDALFVWAGQWIERHPLDFFGCKVVWWATAMPMWMANQNPPLMSFFLAGVAWIFGWHEIPLHAACIGFAFAAAAGIYNLARSWCKWPLLATVIAIFTPAFLVSAATLMCDVPMLGFWIWSITIFARALESEKRAEFALAGVLAGFAILTKYNAVMLLPLMFFMGALIKRKPGWWLIALAVPIIIMELYELLTIKLYGHGLITAAGRYAQSGRFSFPGGATARAIITLSFAGGALLPVFFLGPFLWRARASLPSATIILVGLVLAFSVYDPGLIHPWVGPSAWQNACFRLEVALFTLAGIQIILLVGVDAWQRRDPVGFTLVAWIIGVFFFAGVLNWAINARSFLPACPAVAILAVRRLEVMGRSPGPTAVAIFLAFVAVFSLVIADYQAANATRSYAKKIGTEYRVRGHHLWIVGHSGFQYYLQRLGAKPLDIEHSALKPGDIVAVAGNSGSVVTLPSGTIGALEMLDARSACWVDLSGADRYGLAGFYDADSGPIPFVVGAWTQHYFIAKVLSLVQFPAPLRVSNEAASPKNPDVTKQVWLADNFQMSGQTDKAAQCLRKALSEDPENVEALNDLAVVLVTTKNSNVRDGSEAVQLATKAANLTQFRDPSVIGTLAVADAENGDFPEAVRTAQLAEDLAQLTGRRDVAGAIAKLFDFYGKDELTSRKSGP